MHFGTYMGIYWILKFILFPLGFHIPFLSLLFVILTLAVPFIGYHYVKMYRDKICGGSIQFSHAVLFTIFMYMFASLLVAVVPLHLFPIHRPWLHRQFLHPTLGRVNDQHSCPGRKQRYYKRNDRYRPFTHLNQHYYAITVMGCVLGQSSGYPYRTNGHEKSQTGKQRTVSIVICNS